MQNNKISFHFIDVKFSFENRLKIKEFILQIFRKEQKKVDTVNYIFCKDEYLLILNIEYLKHDTYTDIITFFYSEKEHPLISDIFISIERVKENALKFNKPFRNELLRVIFHGALHLCGYKDKTQADQKLMREKEDYYLQLFDVSRGT